MIKHIVFFKLIDYSEKDRNLIIKELKSKLENLKAFINEINFIEIGINISERPAAFHLSLLSYFDNLENLEKYQNHPKHLEVLNYLKTLKVEVAVIDYTID